MYFRILTVFTITISVCFTDNILPERLSRGAVSSVNYNREDIPVSYAYNSLHPNSKGDTDEKYHSIPNPTLTKPIQYAPLMSPGGINFQYGRYAKMSENHYEDNNFFDTAHVNIDNKKSQKEKPKKEKKPLEPRIEPHDNLYNSGDRLQPPSQIQYVPGHNIEVLRSVNRNPEPVGDRGRPNKIIQKPKSKTGQVAVGLNIIAQLVSQFINPNYPISIHKKVIILNDMMVNQYIVHSMPGDSVQRKNVPFPWNNNERPTSKPTASPVTATTTHRPFTALPIIVVDKIPERETMLRSMLPQARQHLSGYRTLVQEMIPSKMMKMHAKLINVARSLNQQRASYFEMNPPMMIENDNVKSYFDSPRTQLYTVDSMTRLYPTHQQNPHTYYISNNIS